MFFLERVIGLFIGSAIVAFCFYLIDRNTPFADPTLIKIMLTLLSLAMGVFASTIPGFLRIDYSLGGLVLRGSTGFALFLVTFFGAPNVPELNLHDSSVSISRTVDASESTCSDDGSIVDKITVDDVYTFSASFSQAKYIAHTSIKEPQEVEVIDMIKGKPAVIRPESGIHMDKSRKSVFWETSVENNRAKVRYIWWNSNVNDPGTAFFPKLNLKDISLKLILPSEDAKVTNISYEPLRTNNNTDIRTACHGDLKSGRILCTDLSVNHLVIRWDWDVWSGCS